MLSGGVGEVGAVDAIGGAGARDRDEEFVAGGERLRRSGDVRVDGE